MAQFARPDSDLVNEWATSPAWSTMDEVSFSDADFAASNIAPTSDVLAVRLSDVEDPVSSTGHIVRYRYKKDAAGGSQINLTVELRQGYTNEGSQGTLIATWSHTNISDTVTAAAQTLSAGEADSITDYTALVLRFVANQV